MQAGQDDMEEEDEEEQVEDNRDSERDMEEDEDDYQELPWQGPHGVKVDEETVDEDFLTGFDKDTQKHRAFLIEKEREIRDFLQEVEPVWVLTKGNSVSEVLDKLSENTLFLMGHDRNPTVDDFLGRCSKLHKLEMKSRDHISFVIHRIGNGGEKLRKRLHAVRMSVQHARQGLMSLSNTIGYMNDRSDYIVHHSYFDDREFREPPTYGPVIVAPDYLNDDFFSNAKIRFKQFIEDIGTDLNGNKCGWDIKAAAVQDLEKFVREKLAVDGNSFVFLDTGSKRLTKHEIWWESSNHTGPSFQKIPWVKLLNANGRGYEGNLGVISKDHQSFKGFLNKLLKKKEYGGPQTSGGVGEGGEGAGQG